MQSASLIIFWFLGVLQVLFVLFRFTRTKSDLISPSSIVSLTLLFWFYPKIPDLVARASFSATVVEDFLIFWLLCQSAIYIGLHTPRRVASQSRLRSLDDASEQNKWFFFCVLLTAIGGLGFYQLRKLPPEMVFMGSPTGIITILLFFSAFLRIALYVATFLFAKYKRPIYLVPVAVCLLLYADRIIIHGKRSYVFELLFLAGVVWVLALRRRMPMVPAMMAGVLVITANAMVADYRGVMKRESRNVSDLANIEIVSTIRDRFGTADHDIVNAVAELEAFRRSDQGYAAGADFWNDIVFRYVPAQLIGAELKRNLMLQAPDPVFQELQYVRPTGTTTFIAGGLFRNFGWLGFLLLIPYGLFMSHLFRRARYGSIFHLVLYTYFGAMIPLVLIFGLTWFTTNLVFWGPILWVVNEFPPRARTRKRAVQIADSKV